MENLKHKNRDLFQIRSAANAFIVLLLGGILSNCAEADSAVNGGKAAGAIDDPPALTCEEGGVAIEFKTGTKGYIQGDLAQCVLPGAKTTEVTAYHYSGFVFERWTNGEEQRLEETLVIENPSEAQTWTAEFSTIGLNTVWIGYSFLKNSYEYVNDIVSNDNVTYTYTDDNGEEITETVPSPGLGYTDHNGTMYKNGGCKGSPGYMKYEAENKIQKDKDDNGNVVPPYDSKGYSAWKHLTNDDNLANPEPIDNLVLTYYPYVGSRLSDYEYWIDQLNENNPNARIFIVIPWTRGPETGHTLHEDDAGCMNNEAEGFEPDVWPDDAYEQDSENNYVTKGKYTSHQYVFEETNSAEDIEQNVFYSDDEAVLASLATFKKDVLDKLAANYSNKIIVIPQIAVASRILQAHFQNTLSYDDGGGQATLAVTGDKPTSIYADTTGHAGEILRLSNAMLYTSYLYDEDLDTDAYREKVWDQKNAYFSDTDDGILKFPHGLTYFQGLDLVDLVSDIYNGEETTEYQCAGQKMTFRAGVNGAIDGRTRRCIPIGESTEVQAIADIGYSFDQWNDQSKEITRTITANGNDLSLNAEFEFSGYRTVWLANDMVRYSVPFLQDIAKSAEYTTHEDILFYDDGGIYGNLAISNLYAQANNNTDDEVGDQALAYIQNNQINNLVFVHSDVTYDDAGYSKLRYWIREAMRKSPELRIFVVVPWHYQVTHVSNVIPDWQDEPNGNDFDHYWGSTDEANYDLADLLAAMRAEPQLANTSVTVIPQMKLARSIHKQYQSDSSNYLKYQNGTTIVNCHSDEPGLSYFSRAIGCNNTDTPRIAIPGPILSVPTALLYMSYLYDQSISEITMTVGDEEKSVVNKSAFAFADADANSGGWGGSLDANLDEDISQSLSVYGTVGSGTFTPFPFTSTLDYIYNNDSYNPNP